MVFPRVCPECVRVFTNSADFHQATFNINGDYLEEHILECHYLELTMKFVDSSPGFSPLFCQDILDILCYARDYFRLLG